MPHIGNFSAFFLEDNENMKNFEPAFIYLQTWNQTKKRKLRPRATFCFPKQSRLANASIMFSGTTELPQYNYEKHKIFLFKEDFQKFQESLNEAINYINSQQGPAEQRTQEEGEINIDLDF